MNRHEVIEALRAHRETLAEQFGVTSLTLFGSFARDQATDASDIDILVRFDGPATADVFFRTQFYLEDLLGRRVDLVTDKALRKEFRPYVEHEAVQCLTDPHGGRRYHVHEPGGAPMRVSGRGQVTIPKLLRDRFGLHPDVEVEFTPAEDGLLIRTCANGEHDGGAREAALLYGWLKEVNWDGRTARLHDADGASVRLRFRPELDGEMRRLAMEYVEVRGMGCFDEREEWVEVRVEELNETRSWSEPFDVDAFLSDPNPKVFDPQKVAPIDLTDEEFEAFLSTIRQGREA